jgi:hypothetical protein
MTALESPPSDPFERIDYAATCLKRTESRREAKFLELLRGSRDEFIGVYGDERFPTQFAFRDKRATASL